MMPRGCATLGSGLLGLILAGFHLAAQDRRLTLRVYNMAPAPPSIMALAREEAARLLQDAGVCMDWEEGPVEALSQQAPDPGGGARTRVILRIIPHAFASLNRATAGFSVPDGIMATVFYDRVERISRESSILRGRILGLVIAHEVGHMLLTSNEHARMGLMKAQWDKNDLRLAAVGHLRYSAEQARSIRERTAAEPAPAAGGR